FAMRPHGRFTSQIAHLEAGTDVRVQGPFGGFTIDPDYDHQIVMLAAGIGITPFMSMLRHAAETGLTNPILLLYTTKSSSDIPFYEEILALKRRLPRFRVFFLVGDEV